MAKLAISLFFVLLSVTAVLCTPPDALSFRVDNPTPDGDGVVYFTLKTVDGSTPAGNYTITDLSALTNGQLKLWDPVNNNCNGIVLTASAAVPGDGKVCFWANTSVTPEFESSFIYTASNGSASGATGTVAIETYNVQVCPGIPDLGDSGFATVPPSPTVSITLSGLEISFTVTATYLRNNTAWMIDFFDFDASPDGNSADGTGRTCSNHDSSNYASSFSSWWYSQPRADYNSSVDPSITDALETNAFPNYEDSTKWSISETACDTVSWTATIPTSQLISNDTGDCLSPFTISPAATADGLNYTANLYVIALRPKDLNDSSAGYYKISYVYPFKFRLQQIVTDLRSSSSKWAFAVAVEDLQITRGTSMVLELQTTISAPLLDSPNIPNTTFALTNYPSSAAHATAAKPPQLSRVSDNGNCGTSTQSPCVIHWQVIIPELNQTEAGGTMSDYNQQYIGEYDFTWETDGGDDLAAEFTINAVAANTTDLGQLNVPSKINFFHSLPDLFNTTNTGYASPTFSSGEQIFVRHSLLVDANDVEAYVFTLQSAWVCWTATSYVPTVNPGTGCMADVPGVMQLALGQRVQLYNTTAGGIADVTYPAGSTRKSRVYDWTQIGPYNSSWPSTTVNNGFYINALPLVFDSSIHTYYFHLVSEVSQAALPGRKRTVHAVFTMDGKEFTRRDDSDSTSRALLSGITIESDYGSSASTLSASWLSLLNW